VALTSCGDGVDAGALQTVPRTLGETELFDANVELAGGGLGRADVAQLQGRRFVIEVADQFHQRTEGLAAEASASRG